MKKSVKILIFVSVIAILTALCVFADEENGYVYSVYNGEAIITDYVGTKMAFNIPDTLGGYPVTAIGPNAFRNKNIYNLTVPNSVLSFGEGAFADNPNLSTFNYPIYIKSIPAYAFENDSSLDYFNIYGDVKSIGDGAFKNCTNISAMYYYGEQDGWDSISFGEDWNYGVPDYYFEIISGFELVDFHTIDSWTWSVYRYYNDAGRDVVIPAYYAGVPVTMIDTTTFTNKKITSVIIPDTVNNIRRLAFNENPDLKSVELPPNLTIISYGLFMNDTGLEEVFIPAAVEIIQDKAFQGCTSLKDIYYGGTAARWDDISKNAGWNEGVPADCVVHFESTGLPVDGVSEPESNRASATNLRRHAALRFTATSEDYNSFDKLGFLISRKDTMKSYGFAELNHDTKICGTPLYIEAICVDETHNRVYGENNTGVRTYSVIASIPSDKTDTVFVARPFLEIGACTVYGAAMEGSFDGLSV